MECTELTYGVAFCQNGDRLLLRLLRNAAVCLWKRWQRLQAFPSPHLRSIDTCMFSCMLKNPKRAISLSAASLKRIDQVSPWVNWTPAGRPASG